jgi:hypothetical protein
MRVVQRSATEAQDCANRLTDPYPQCSAITLLPFELMANATIQRRISAPIKGTQCSVPRRSVKQRQLSRVPNEQQRGRKMDQHDRELLDKQMRRLSPPRNDGVIVVLLAAMFLVGMTVGGVLSEPIQIASIE